jgi:DNA-binding response OmpR family regulator
VSEISILAVDDSDLILEMLKDCLEDSRFKVVTAGNGEEGLKILEQIKPDLIISDIVMPVMDGWQFCEAIRKNPDTTSIPFLFLTSEKEVPKRIRGLKLGADDYLTKPFSRVELLSRVNRIVDKVARVRQDMSMRRAALSGHTSHLAMADLLQLLSLNGKTGVLRLEREEQGRIYFRNGKIIDARLGQARGLKALYRLLGWQEAHFELEPLEDAGSEETIQESTQGVIMEGFTHLDEVEHLRERLPAQGERLCAAAPAREVADEERQVLAAIGGGCTLGELLDRLPLPDLRIMEAVLALRERGLVESGVPAGAGRR